MNDQAARVLKILEDTGSVMKGHFILSSGKHSDTYIQLCKLFEKKSLSYFVEICHLLAQTINDKFSANIDSIFAPAMGAVIVGYEVAKSLQKNYMFCERVSGKFQLRRGFSMQNSNVIIVENVITTGKSALEAADCARSNGANVIGIASVIDRSKGNPFDCEYISLCKIDTNEYEPDEKLPQHMKEIKPIKPGSKDFK